MSVSDRLLFMGWAVTYAALALALTTIIWTLIQNYKERKRENERIHREHHEV